MTTTDGLTERQLRLLDWMKAPRQLAVHPAIDWSSAAWTVSDLVLLTKTVGYNYAKCQRDLHVLFARGLVYEIVPGRCESGRAAMTAEEEEQRRRSEVMKNSRRYRDAVAQSGGPVIAYIGSAWEAEVEEYGYFSAVVEPDEDHPIRVVMTRSGRGEAL